ncbi:reverse transcriptase domain-containing protein [Streptococcus dysgalactiae]|uniref:reverse transcriptase domain-containing protein n=1 Tax=Streptococcus dysgalactiae TaxID=1334 RepID=UPI00194E2E44
MNPKKPGKVRVVFDGAAKFNGVSLNDRLHQGPNVVQNLVQVLLRFRIGRFALSGDIEEMFLQVRVPEMDRNYLRFLWWQDNDINGSIKDFSLSVHPFGARSSPFCANSALQQCAHLYEGSDSELVLSALRDCFYVDDLLVSMDSKERLFALLTKLSALLRSAGFHIAKWTSNSRYVLERIPPKELSKSYVDLTFQALPIERTLGMEWDAHSDCFRFSMQLPSRPATRRGICRVFLRNMILWVCCHPYFFQLGSCYKIYVSLTLIGMRKIYVFQRVVSSNGLTPHSTLRLLNFLVAS